MEVWTLGHAGSVSAPRAAPAAVLGLACAAQFMVVLDVSVVNVALPSIQTTLGFDPVALQWVASGYALVFAGFLLLGGRLADLHGRRRIFLLGLALFTAASLVGGSAGTPGTLVAARAAQGLGAAVLAPATLTILTTTFPEGPRRTRALAIWTAVSLVGGATGNLVGGALTQFLGWRWILLINVPIGAAAILLAVRCLGAGHRRNGKSRLDVRGAVLATVGLTTLTYGVTRAQTGGWGDPAVVGVVLLGLAALAVFIFVEARVARAPLIPPRLFRMPAVARGNVLMLLAGAAFQIPMWYFLTLYMQNVLHYDALRTGLAFLPHTVLMLVVGLHVTPRLMTLVDTRTLVTAGALIAAGGFWWQSRVTPDSGYVSGILGPAVLMSVGGGLLNTPLTATVTSGVDPADAGAASGLMNTTKQFGGALGLAGLLTTFGTTTAGYGRVFLAVAVLMVVVAVLARTLPPRRDTDDPTPHAVSGCRPGFRRGRCGVGGCWGSCR